MSLKLNTSTAIGIMLSLVMSYTPVAFAADSMTLEFAPHCTEKSGCKEYTATDGDHFTTDKLVAGDILDIDVLIRGLDHSGVRTVKSWIKYDPQILEARSVELTSALPSPTPGEQTIDQAQGIVKIGGSTSSGFSSETTRIARVTFRVKETSSNTELRFDGYNETGNGNSAINGERRSGRVDGGLLPPPPCFDVILGCHTATSPLLIGEPAKLTVQLFEPKQANILTAQAAGISSSVASSNSSSSAENTTSLIPATTTLDGTSSTSSASSVGGVSLSGLGSTFGILQVQDVRVATKDNLIFLSWQALKSAELAGYNVYYGTVSGRYIQRRSLPASATSLVLRDLEPGNTYFLAVRAVNTQDQESVFSQEVSVTVGKPETATSPMTKLPQDFGAVTGNPIETHGGTIIEGETGGATIFVWAIFASAIIGTAFAFRRQLSL